MSQKSSKVRRNFMNKSKRHISKRRKARKERTKKMPFRFHRINQRSTAKRLDQRSVDQTYRYSVFTIWKLTTKLRTQ